MSESLQVMMEFGESTYVEIIKTGKKVSEVD